MTNIGAPPRVASQSAPGGLPNTRWLWVACWVLALLLGLAQVWASRFILKGDSMSYLDIARAISRGHWGEALNAHWSPLYPTVLGLALRVVGPSTGSEILFAHLVHFAFYVGALWCFSFFLRSLLDAHRSADSKASSAGFHALPEWAWITLGFALLTFSSLQLTHLVLLNPDLGVSAVVFLAGGLLLHIRAKPTGWRIYLILGVLLGLAYWLKAPMFPMAFVFMFAAAVAAGNLRIALPRVGVSLLAFLIVACPLVLALSRAQGHLTLGESAKMNLVWHLYDVDTLNWQGEPPGTGTPKHPPRKILDAPPVYSFAAHLKGTYPPWYDPAYWNDGMKARVTLRREIRAVLRDVESYYELFVLRQGTILAGIVALLALSGTWRQVIRNLWEYAFLLVPSLGAFCMYGLVYVEPRYIAGYVVVLWLTLLSGVRLPLSPEFQRTCAAVVIFVVLVLGVQIAGRVLTDFKNESSNSPQVQWAIAENLRHMGVAPGDTVAVAGDAVNEPWPHIAQLSIVAETRDVGREGFWWAADPQAKERVFQAFAETGAKALVADRMPAPNWSGDWQQIGNTPYFVHLLR